MKINSDFKDLLQLLNDGQVRYLVVGAYAVMKYTEPRYTKDLDIWIEPTPENADRALAALQRFGAPVHGLAVADLIAPELIYQIGVDPNRVDILSHLAGIPFADAWERRIAADLGGIAVPVLSRDDLIAAKEAAGRPQDLIDAANLRRAKELKF